jgi:hypothetical protein
MPVRILKTLSDRRIEALAEAHRGPGRATDPPCGNMCYGDVPRWTPQSLAFAPMGRLIPHGLRPCAVP